MGCCIKDLLKHLEPIEKNKNKKRKEYLENINDKIEFRGSEIIKLKDNHNLNKNEKLLSEREKKLKDWENSLKKKKTLFEKEKQEYEEQKEKDKKLLEEKIKNVEDLNQEKEKILLENNTLIKYKSENEEKEKDILIKAKTIKEKDDEIEKLKKELEEKNKELMENKNLIENKDNDIKNNIAEKNLELIKREKTLDQKEQQLMDLEKILKGEQDPILKGLNNIGATCYMNASLQCFSNSKKLTEYFLKHYQKAPNKIMANEYYEVLKNLWNKDDNEKAYSPNSFKDVLSKENPLFAGIAANDSKDLINFLLERFHQELNIVNNINNINNDSNINQPDQTNEQLMLKLFLDEFKEKFNSIISTLFYGILETKSQCQGCNVIKFNFQVYSFLEFPLQQVNQYYFNLGKRSLVTKDGKNPDVNLYECFEYNKKIDDSTNNQPTLQNNNNIEINMESKGENKDKTIIIPENQNLAIFNENPQQLRYETYITADISSSEYELNSFDTFIGVKDNIYYLVYNNMKNFNIDIMNIAEKKVIKSLSGHYIRTSVIRYYLNSVKEEYILSCDINSKAIIWDVTNDYTIKYILRMEYKSIIRDAILLFGLNQKNYLIISRASKEEYTKVYELAPNTPFVRNIPKPKKKITNSIIPWKHNNKQYIIELCNGIISIKNVLENENFSDLNMEKDDNYLSGFIYKDHQLFVNITNKKQIIVLNLINRDIDKIINLPYSSFSLIQWSDRYGIVGSNDLEIVDLEKMEVVGFLNVKNTLYGIKKIKNDFFGEGFISCDEKKIVNLFCVYNK